MTIFKFRNKTHKVPLFRKSNVHKKEVFSHTFKKEV